VTIPAETPFPYRIVDSRNQGWLHQPSAGPDLYDGFDPTASAPRPLADAQLAALAEEPGHEQLSVEQVAAIVAHLPVRAPQLADDPTAGLQAIRTSLNLPGVTADRLARIMQRFYTETSDERGPQVTACPPAARMSGALTCVNV
jgi:hypothetical protein